MRRARFFSIGSSVIAVLLVWLAISSPAAFAQADARPEMAVVVADSLSVREAKEVIPLAMSLIGLLATQQEGDVVFLDTNRPGEAVGPFSASDYDYQSSRSDIAARLGAGSTFTSQAIVEALEEARSALSTYGAPAGSTIYLALGGSGDIDYEALGSTASPLVDRIAEQGWSIQGLILDADDQGAAQFLDTIAKTTGGTVFGFESGADMRPLANHVFGSSGEGSVQEFAAEAVVDTKWFSTAIPIMPGTEETMLYLFKEGSSGSFQLVTPSDEVLSGESLSSSKIFETQHLEVWRLKEPAPGIWRAETTAVEGAVSIWGSMTDRYELVLRTNSPVPTGESSVIMGYAAQDGRTAVLEGVRMFATVSGPDVSAIEYELYDDGTRGDSQAGDGYFTVRIPSIELAGTYDVTLEMLWPSFNHRISADYSLDAQPFPSFFVETRSARDLQPGEARNIGTVSIHVDGGPYAVDPEAIMVSMATTGAGQGTLDLVPHRLFGDGPAWQYDIVFTPSEYGSHTLQFNLSLDHAGRTFVESSDSIVVSTVAGPAVVPPVIVEPVETTAVTPAVKPVAPESAVAGVAGVPAVPAVAGVAAVPVPQSQFPWMIVVTLMVVAAPIAAGVLYFLTRPKPYGYIYTEDEDELVDFSAVERQPVLRFFYRGLIRGSELNIPGFEGLVFHFMEDRLEVRSFGEHSTVRVNNQPLIYSATIEDKTWIGTGGKLYTFLSSPIIPPDEPEAEPATKPEVEPATEPAFNPTVNPAINPAGAD